MRKSFFFDREYYDFSKDEVAANCRIYKKGHTLYKNGLCPLKEIYYGHKYILEDLNQKFS